VKESAENSARWYGIYAEFKCYPSHRCPLCGGELREVRTKRARIVQCQRCGFYEDRDYTPFYHWTRELGLPLPKHPLRALPKPNDPEA